MNTEYGRIWDWKSHEDSPLRWRNPCVARLKGDPFEETPFEVLDRVFAVMALRPDVTFQLLTKRPERMREYLTQRDTVGAIAITIREVAPDGGLAAMQSMGTHVMRDVVQRRWPLPNVWLGTSAEDQAAADRRIPELLACPAAVRFVSAEPLLGPVEFRPWALQLTCCGLDDGRAHRATWKAADELRESYLSAPGHERTAILSLALHWVIVGGESGPGARPCDIGWIRSIVGQCKAAGVAAFVKQVGAAPTSWCVDSLLDPGYEFEPDFCDVWEASEGPRCEGRCRMLRDRKGGAMAEWPEDLRVREMPR